MVLSIGISTFDLWYIFSVVYIQAFCRFLLYRRKYVQCKRGFVLLESVVQKKLQRKAFNHIPHRMNKVNATESETEIAAS